MSSQKALPFLVWLVHVGTTVRRFFGAIIFDCSVKMPTQASLHVADWTSPYIPILCLLLPLRVNKISGIAHRFAILDIRSQTALLINRLMPDLPSLAIASISACEVTMPVLTFVAWVSCSTSGFFSPPVSPSPQYVFPCRMYNSVAIVNYCWKVKHIGQSTRRKHSRGEEVWGAHRNGVGFAEIGIEL